MGSINKYDFTSSTYYHALQASMRRAHTRGLSYTLAYTWSKTISYGTFTDFPDSGARLRAGPRTCWRSATPTIYPSWAVAR